MLLLLCTFYNVATVMYFLQCYYRYVLSTMLLMLCLFVCFWRCGLTRAMASSFTRFLDHTQRRTTVGRTPMDASGRLNSASQRPLSDNTQHLQQTSMLPVGFEPNNLSRRAAAGLRLRPCGHWERLSN